MGIGFRGRGSWAWMLAAGAWDAGARPVTLDPWPWLKHGQIKGSIPLPTHKTYSRQAAPFATY